MSKSITPIAYHYDIDGHDVKVTRRHVRTAYARNGNVSNPTEYFVWDARVDGEYVVGNVGERSTAYEYARARVLGIDYFWDSNQPTKARNVRSFRLVQDEMKANYVRQERTG